MVKSFIALACHFCLALPAAFTQPGDHLIAESCIAAAGRSITLPPPRSVFFDSEKAMLNRAPNNSNSTKEGGQKSIQNDELIWSRTFDNAAEREVPDDRPINVMYRKTDRSILPRLRDLAFDELHYPSI